MFYDWQLKAFEAIDSHSAILSAPTGSGKTWVAYLWSGLIDLEGKTHPPKGRVIFTAPIKALSNERYLELKRMGFDVGLETGDFKKNAGAPVLCCTMEIYTLKYARKPAGRVIVDEFHYIFNDKDRTRAYIDGIRGTHPSTEILVMSATFGEPGVLKDYLEEMARRDFILYETRERATELVFLKKGTKFPRIRDALVFVFSRKGAEYLADQISATRRKISAPHRSRLKQMAQILEVNWVPGVMLRGVGVYHGSLLPKEKFLVEMAFRERIIDVVVGTDALSLGVNLPAETVVFGQMAKFIDGPLKKNEFLQMAGRAGRKGFFDTGYVTYLPRSKAEHYDYDTESLYHEVLHSPCEPARVTLGPAVARLLRKEATPEEEARLVANCSLPHQDFGFVLGELEDLLRTISRFIRRLPNPHDRPRLKRILAEVWFDEMSVSSNIAVAQLFLAGNFPNAMRVAEILKQEERNYLQALLKVKRYANRLPEGYGFSSIDALDEAVRRIDATVYGFEEKLQKLNVMNAPEFEGEDESDG